MINVVFLLPTLSDCLFVCLPACLFVCLSICLSVYLSACLSVCLSLFVCMRGFVCVYPYLSTFTTQRETETERQRQRDRESVREGERERQKEHRQLARFHGWLHSIFQCSECGAHHDYILYTHFKTGSVSERNTTQRFVAQVEFQLRNLIRSESAMILRNWQRSDL